MKVDAFNRGLSNWNANLNENAKDNSLDYRMH